MMNISKKVLAIAALSTSGLLFALSTAEPQVSKTTHEPVKISWEAVKKMSSRGVLDRVQLIAGDPTSVYLHLPKETASVDELGRSLEKGFETTGLYDPTSQSRVRGLLDKARKGDQDALIEARFVDANMRALSEGKGKKVITAGPGEGLGGFGTKPAEESEPIKLNIPDAARSKQAKFFEVIEAKLGEILDNAKINPRLRGAFITKIKTIMEAAVDKKGAVANTDHWLNVVAKFTDAAVGFTSTVLTKKVEAKDLAERDANALGVDPAHAKQTAKRGTDAKEALEYLHLVPEAIAQDAAEYLAAGGDMKSLEAAFMGDGPISGDAMFRLVKAREAALQASKNPADYKTKMFEWLGGRGIDKKALCEPVKTPAGEMKQGETCPITAGITKELCA